MKLFCVSDVHSFYYELLKALGDAGFEKDNPDHIFISCGDLFDRGGFPDKVLSFVLSLNPDRRIFIRGNHEDLIEQLIARGKPEMHDISNGTAQTIIDLTRNQIENPARHFKEACNCLKFNSSDFNEYLDECVNYAEIGNYIFVHGWIPCERDDPNIYHTRGIHYKYMPDWREAHASDWKAARWTNGMDAWWNDIRVPNKAVVCGHYHTSWARKHIEGTGEEWENKYNPDREKPDFSTWKNDGIIALDGCTALSGKVNCEVIEIEGELR